MADTRAYTYYIRPYGSTEQEDYAVHQTSPAWVLTFVRWKNRDTFRVTDVGSTEVRDPLVVENDCIQVSTTIRKGTLTPSVTATLKMTDINYESDVAPGDFMFVNILNWETDARDVANKARAKKPINGINDGFKGVFKVQGVRKIINVDPNTGTKILLFKIDGFAFTEFNNTIYFNPYLIDPNQDPKNQLLFASFIGEDWTHLINAKGLTNVQDVIAVLIQSFIGTGITKIGELEKKSVVPTKNTHFFIPQLVGTYLGVKAVKAAKDIYIYMFGIQKYSGSAVQSVAQGMNPDGVYQKFNRFYYTNDPCGGDTLLKPEYWNQVQTWSILNQYSNAPLNELFTCFRVSPEGDVMPTVVFRQIPFSTEDFTASKLPISKFLNIPRWKIDTALILSQDIGREEAARINFVQYFGKSTVTKEGAEIVQEIAKGNFAYDVEDVQRSGLRPYIVTTQFDELTSVKKEFHSPDWAKIVGDCLIGGHLKLNGTIVCAGIQDPIAIGDNLELDGIVYHIEQITHMASITAVSGIKIFRTTLQLSSGVSVTSSEKGTRYGEMTYTSGDAARQDDYNRNQILPGVSESQDVVYRPNNLDAPASKNAPFPQPDGIKRQQKKKGGRK